ncbi:SDR family oxidoreductase [Wenjunlia tyrosinilytica]|uniref:3-oxoacyl-ACP reductase n=1 Tax=Wenjunlia tyrosinilytica TaxID=1544741 RepID=A0A918E022_9ACTN|nr:SDR family oxidoreductase [Wenjunlia tyrosinilytica]GGO91844.1 3-oxoacyl-ACP reductase [Wenjunlia tyrosinilytica]
MDLGIEGRTALVAAATGGLGLATAAALAAEGARVVLFGRDEERAAAAAAGLPAAVGLTADLTDPDAPRRVVQACESRYGPVDILVLNSGGPPMAAATETTEEQLAAAHELLLLSAHRLLTLVLPGMRRRGWGRVVAIGSSGVEEPLPGLALSNTYRAGLAGLLKTVAGEVAADGVTVNLLLPGRIATQRVASLDRAAAARTGRTPEEVAAASRGKIPAGRYGRPEEFAAVAAFLCGEPASFVTGSRIRVDGGLIAGH